jgi:ABC-type transport system substrate-binding protein
MEQAAGVIKVVTGNYQAALWAQFDAPNPALDTVWWDPRGDLKPPAFTLNMARNDDPEILSSILAALAAGDDASFKAAIGKIQQRLGADIPYVWLYHDVVAIIADKRVVNIANYTLPDGAKGLAIDQGAHPVAQIWMRT